MNKPTIDIITLGCSKNLVDSETLMGLFEAHGYHVTHDSDNPQGEIAVVNTCGFIEDAKQESIDTILELAQAKEEGRLKQLYVMGCLSERYLAELEAEIQRFLDLEGLQKLPRNASPTRLKNRDMLDGRPRGYMRRFGMSRITFREKASKGEIPGVTKSSW